MFCTSCSGDSLNDQAVKEASDYTTYFVVGLFPLSDNFSEYGKAMKTAARLAENDINSWLVENDREWRFKLETPDTRYFGSDAREHVQEWHEKGVDFFIGPTSSESVKSCLNYSNNKLLMISPSANSVELAEASASFYSFNAKSSDQATAIVKAAADAQIEYLIPVLCKRSFTEELQQQVIRIAERSEIDASQRNFIIDCSNADFSEDVADLEAYVNDNIDNGKEINEVGISFMATEQSIEFLASAAESETLQKLFWFGNNWLVRSDKLVHDDLVAEFASNVAFISPMLSIVDFPADSNNTHVKGHLDQELSEDAKLFAYNTYDIMWSLALSLDQGGYSVENVEKLLPSNARSWTRKNGASGHVVLDNHGNRINADYDYWAINQNLAWEKIGSFSGLNNTATWQSNFLEERVAAKQEQVKDEHRVESTAPVEFDEPFEERYADSDVFSKHLFEERGNTVGNIIYGGIAARQGLWIYYSNRNDNGYLYKMRSDGTGMTRLNEDDTFDVNILGDWVYYRNGSDDNKVYKVRIDGTGRARLTDHEARYVSVVDSWIYFRSYDRVANQYMLVKMRNDGTEMTTILHFEDYSEPTYVNVIGGFIYYSLNDIGCQFSSGDLYRVNTDGTENIKILSGRIAMTNAVGDWIYYIDLLEGPAKVRPDGSEKTAMKNIGWWLNVDEDWVFSVRNYENEQSGIISKVHRDGSGYTRVLDDQFSYGIVPFNESFNIAGDWIFFYNYGEQYRMRTDGSSLQLVE